MDFIPFQDAKFDEWLENFKTKVSAIATPLGVPAPLITAVTDGYDDWDTAFDANTAAQDAAHAAARIKDNARVAAEVAVRAVVGIMQKNPALTNGNREILHITVPDKKPTPTSPEYVAQLDPPLLILDTSKPSQVTVHFGINPTNEKLNKKPENIKGAKVWYRIESGPWTYVADDTNSPYIHFLSISEPQNLEYKAQWFDTQSRSGPFGKAIACTVTPG